MMWKYFFLNDTATTEIYTLSLHDALPISSWSHAAIAAVMPAVSVSGSLVGRPLKPSASSAGCCATRFARRSEEHTSELQSRQYLVCRLLLEKKKNHLHSFHFLSLCRSDEP